MISKVDGVISMYCFMMFSERPLKKSTSCQLCLTYGITLCGILALSSAVYLIPFDPSVRSQTDLDDPYKAVDFPKQPKQEGSLVQHLRRDDRQLGFLPRSRGVRVA